MKWYDQFLEETINNDPPFTNEKQAQKFALNFDVNGNTKEFGDAGDFTTYMVGKPKIVKNKTVQESEIVIRKRKKKELFDRIKGSIRKNKKAQLKFHTGTEVDGITHF